MIEHDIKRFQNKGLGYGIAWAITLVWLTQWMEVMRYIWPTYMKLADDYNVSPFVHTFVFLDILHCCNFLTGNIFFYFVYTSKIALFEKDRSRGHPDEKWPWESMRPEEWNKLFWDSIYRNILNSLVMTNLVNFGLLSVGHTEPFLTEIDQMPSVLLFAA